MSSPAVSVIVPTYNRRALLPRALDSIVAQTFDNWEIVLVDDGSTDGTEDVAARYQERLKERFIYIPQLHKGSSRARNRGIDACSGRFVAFLDSDDEFLPTKLERQLGLFDLRPDLGLVYSDYAFVDLDGIRHESAFDATHPTARAVPYESVGPCLCICKGNLFDVLIRAYFISTIVGMVRREVLGASVRFPVDQIFGEEWLFYLTVAKSCRAGFVDEPLSVYHYQRGSLSRTDKRRNARCYQNLLRAIHDAFDDLSREQRRAVRRNLGRLGRQLGCSAYRAGRYADALAHFAGSFRYEPGVRTFYNMLEAAVRRLLAGNADGTVYGSQETRPAVR